MKARKYAQGGPIGPKGKGQAKDKKSAYELNREKTRKEREEKAQTLRAQGVYNRAASAEAMGETERARRIEENATGRGIPTSSAQTRTMGVAGPGASAEAAVKRRTSGVGTFESKAEMPAAGASAEDRAAKISREVGEYTMSDARKRGIKLKNGGMIPRRK
jgi:hypothetical protein